MKGKQNPCSFDEIMRSDYSGFGEGYTRYTAQTRRDLRNIPKLIDFLLGTFCPRRVCDYVGLNKKSALYSTLELLFF